MIVKQSLLSSSLCLHQTSSSTNGYASIEQVMLVSDLFTAVQSGQFDLDHTSWTDSTPLCILYVSDHQKRYRCQKVWNLATIIWTQKGNVPYCVTLTRAQKRNDTSKQHPSSLSSKSPAESQSFLSDKTKRHPRNFHQKQDAEWILLCWALWCVSVGPNWFEDEKEQSETMGVCNSHPYNGKAMKKSTNAHRKNHRPSVR